MNLEPDSFEAAINNVLDFYNKSLKSLEKIDHEAILEVKLRCSRDQMLIGLQQIDNLEKQLREIIE